MEDFFLLRNGSIFLPQIQLYLDARKKQSFGFISHAHGDHIAHHKKILCTPETARILSLRLKSPDCMTLPFFRKKRINDASITFLPAGHILGSAQIYFESTEGSLLYTGDFRTKASRTAESIVYQSCDVLIMETTFGNPKYIFPPRKEVEEKLLAITRKKLNEGITPVIYAYPLGKSQEVLHLLSHAKLPVAVDYSILRYVYIYEQLGIKFGNYEKFKRSDYHDKVLLLPASFCKNKYINNMTDIYTIYLSGWGMDTYAPYHFNVDTVLPYSDHADYEELLTFVDRLHPKKVYCTHGFDGFVTELRERGYQTKLLDEPDQYGLFS